MGVQGIVQLPYPLNDAMTREQLILATDRNLKEVERMLSILQRYMKNTGVQAIEDIGELTVRDEDDNVYLDTDKLSDKMVGLNNALQIAQRAVGNLNLAVDAVQPENMSAAAIKAAQPQWATHAINKDYAIINSSPLAGYVAWQNVKVTYKGEEYTIIDGNSNMRYIWWDYDYPTVMQTANSLVDGTDELRITNDDALIFYNKFGMALVVPGATVLDGGLTVPGTVTADAIAADTITARELAAGSVTANEIAAGAVTSEKIGANEVDANNIAAGAIITEHIAAEGVSASKIKGDTLTLGGANNVNGELSIKSADNIEVVRGNNDGIRVDGGSYLIHDMDMDMSLLQIPNLIPDHSFECLEWDRSGDTDSSDYNDYEIIPDTSNDFIWRKQGLPKVLPTQTLALKEAAFGYQSVAVNNANYLYIKVGCKSSTKYYLSGFATRGYRNPSSGTAAIYLTYKTASGTTISSTAQSFNLNSGIFDWKRIGYAFTTPNDCVFLQIEIRSSDSYWVYWDGMQLAEGTNPVRYDPEDNLWNHLFGTWGIPVLGHVVETGVSANGIYMRFSNRIQICWENHYIGNVEFITQTANAVYGGHTGTLTFPAPFVGMPIVACNARSNGYLNSQVSSVTASNVQIRIWSNYSTTMTGVTRDWIAIGWW